MDRCRPDFRREEALMERGGWGRVFSSGPTLERDRSPGKIRQELQETTP